MSRKPRGITNGQARRLAKLQRAHGHPYTGKGMNAEQAAAEIARLEAPAQPAAVRRAPQPQRERRDPTPEQRRRLGELGHNWDGLTRRLATVVIGGLTDLQAHERHNEQRPEGQSGRRANSDSLAGRQEVAEA
jgi:hypothetical protein